MQICAFTNWFIYMNIFATIYEYKVANWSIFWQLSLSPAFWDCYYDIYHNYICMSNRLQINIDKFGSQGVLTSPPKTAIVIISQMQVRYTISMSARTKYRTLHGLSIDTLYVWSYMPVESEVRYCQTYTSHEKMIYIDNHCSILFIIHNI